jgi:hypothetical protein
MTSLPYANEVSACDPPLGAPNLHVWLKKELAGNLYLPLWLGVADDLATLLALDVLKLKTLIVLSLMW